MNPRELRQIGRYRVRRFIAEGGMAWVFEVEDPTFGGRRLALKMLKPEAGAGEQFQRFESEAHLLAGIDHPNLVTIFDFGQDEETESNFYTMTLVEGATLSERGALPLEEAAPIFLEVLAGLARLHDRHIVHRDIKPANILLHSDGRAVLADLGIARVEDQASELTKTMMAIGTVRYMSPEQARGHRVGPASDVFSVGLTLYQTLTGHSVYESVDDIDSSSGQSILFYLGAMSSRAGAELPLQFPDEVPNPVRQVLLRACRFKAEDRYATAREMREALVEALQKAERKEGDGIQIPRALVAGLLGGIVLAIVIYWYASNAMGRSNADQALESVALLERTAVEAVDQVAAFNPPPPAGLIESIRDNAISRARVVVHQGRTKLEAGRFEIGIELLEDAGKYYQSACQQLLDGDLQRRTDAAAGNAKMRFEELAIPAARELRPQRFAELDGLLPSLAAPETGTLPCPGAEAQLARLATSGTVGARAALLERDLRAEWPKLAERAQNAAAAAAADASRVPSEAPAYLEPMNEGRIAQREGEAALEREEFLEARRAFGEAREAFDVAGRIAPAAHARDLAREALQRASSAGLSDSKLVDNTFADAGSLFEDQRWDEAREEYANATKLIDNWITDRQKSEAAVAAADASEALRAAAIAEGAQRSATERLERADDARMKAKRAFEARRYDEAEREFRQASKLYTEAQREGRQVLELARGSETKARAAATAFLGDRNCAQLSGPPLGPCEAGTESLRLGELALREHDAGAALQSFENAAERFAEAARAADDFEANRPQPPYLVSRQPAETAVRAFRNDEVTFSVEAADPNSEDELRFSWKVDGKKAGSNSPSYSHRGTRDARISVEVRDGHKGRLRQDWVLSLANRRPTLALTPGSRQLTLKVGDQQEFRAQVTDPDGDTAQTSFSLDGKSVAKGSSYRFQAARAGAYKLVARAVDPAGAAASRSVRIQVDPVATPKPKPPPKPKPTPAPATKPKPTAKPAVVAAVKTPAPVEDPQVTPAAAGAAAERAGLDALKEYEAAYEARDVGRLARVWLMNRNQRQSMAGFFEDVENLSVDVEIKSVTVENETVYIDFDQTIRSESRARLPKKAALMTATVIPRAGGRWVISSILPRG